jgi:CTP:molybdopterin cytidylyltransferase MocA
MKSRTPKLLHPLCGRPMVAYVVDAARAAFRNDLGAGSLVVGLICAAALAAIGLAVAILVGSASASPTTTSNSSCASAATHLPGAALA